MPLKDGRLTRTETAFVEAYAEVPDRARAEKLAGLAPRSGYMILARPEIQAQIARRISAEMSDLAPIATAKLRHLLTSDKVPAQVLFNAVKYTLDTVQGANPGTAHKELHEMSADDLAAAINTLSARASDLARDVSPSPDPGGVFD